MLEVSGRIADGTRSKALLFSASHSSPMVRVAIYTCASSELGACITMASQRQPGCDGTETPPRVGGVTRP
jgi:hypothetical protein